MKSAVNKKNIIIFILLTILVVARMVQDYREADHKDGSQANSSVIRAYQEQKENSLVSGSGKVVKILSDDLKGSKHQRFILRISSDLTVLIAHNIDLAPRIPTLQVGKTVTFKGQYEYQARGGVIHWTHHDPQGRRQGGWLEYEGKRFQ